MSKLKNWQVIILIIFTFGFGVLSGYDIGEDAGYDICKEEYIEIELTLEEWSGHNASWHYNNGEGRTYDANVGEGVA